MADRIGLSGKALYSYQLYVRNDRNVTGSLAIDLAHLLTFDEV